MTLPRQIGEFGRFLAKFVFGLRQFFRETAKTGIEKPFPEWEPPDRPTDYCLVAGGAFWSCDGQGEWHLLETNGLEEEVAVFELLKYLHMPIPMDIKSAKKKIVCLPALAAIAKVGLGLPESYLVRFCQREDAEAKADSTFPVVEEQRETEGPESKKQRVRSCCLSDPSKRIFNDGDKALGHGSPILAEPPSRGKRKVPGGMSGMICGLMFLLLSGGCSLLKVSKTAPPEMLVPLTVSENQKELERQVLRFGEDVVSKVAAEGAEPKAPLVGQARESIRLGRAGLGEPARAIPVPDQMAQESTKAAAVQKALSKALSRSRSEAAAWEREYEIRRGTPVKSGWSFSMPILWGLPLWGVLLVVLAALIPGLGTWILGKALAATRRALQQVVAGVQAFFDTTTPENEQALKSALSRAMVDTRSDTRVHEIKRAIGK